MIDKLLNRRMTSAFPKKNKPQSKILLVKQFVRSVMRMRHLSIKR